MAYRKLALASEHAGLGYSTSGRTHESVQSPTPPNAGSRWHARSTSAGYLDTPSICILINRGQLDSAEAKFRRAQMQSTPGNRLVALGVFVSGCPKPAYAGLLA